MVILLACGRTAPTAPAEPPTVSTDPVCDAPDVPDTRRLEGTWGPLDVCWTEPAPPQDDLWTYVSRNVWWDLTSCLVPPVEACTGPGAATFTLVHTQQINVDAGTFADRVFDANGAAVYERACALDMWGIPPYCCGEHVETGAVTHCNGSGRYVELTCTGVYGPEDFGGEPLDCSWLDTWSTGDTAASGGSGRGR